MDSGMSDSDRGNREPGMVGKGVIRVVAGVGGGLGFGGGGMSFEGSTIT